jgi:hypothetical protein
MRISYFFIYILFICIYNCILIHANIYEYFLMFLRNNWTSGCVRPSLGFIRREGQENANQVRIYIYVYCCRDYHHYHHHYDSNHYHGYNNISILRLSEVIAATRRKNMHIFMYIYMIVYICMLYVCI